MKGNHAHEVLNFPYIIFMEFPTSHISLKRPANTCFLVGDVAMEYFK